jgi:hypothetical protein
MDGTYHSRVKHVKKKYLQDYRQLRLVMFDLLQLRILKCRDCFAICLNAY